MFSCFPAASATPSTTASFVGRVAKPNSPIGINNFRRGMGDPVPWNAFVTVSILILFINLFKMTPSILIAVLIHRIESDQWQSIYRVLLVVPMIVPPVSGPA